MKNVILSNYNNIKIYINDVNKRNQGKFYHILELEGIAIQVFSIMARDLKIQITRMISESQLGPRPRLLFSIFWLAASQNFPRWL